MAGEERLRALSKLLESAQNALHGLDKDQRAQRTDDFARLEAASGYLSLVLERTEPELLIDVVHTELTRLLEQITSNTSSVAANPVSFADALIGQAAQLPAAQGRDFEQAGRDAATSFRRSASQHQNALHDEIQTLRQKLDDIAEGSTTTLETTKKSGEALMQELQDRLQAMEASASAANEDVAKLVERQQAEFLEEQTSREERAEEQWSEVRSRIDTQAEELVDDLSRMRSEAAGLVGAVSAASTANHFRDDAIGERKAYWILLAVTLCALGAAVIFAGLAASEPEADARQLLAKLGVSGALIGLGVFTGAQARDHRGRDKRSRDKELDMRVFGPFIEPLPAKEQVRERILMTRRSFGRVEPSAPEQTSEEIDLLSTPDEIEIAARDMRQRNKA
ncbi:MAG: hypothetical protein MSC31_01310 [Solirubrobacteraceae bacterium MAG38_C4-C5]|nr:hypothetical protein [Candidatus Siliceabacter maunaloa]